MYKLAIVVSLLMLVGCSEDESSITSGSGTSDVTSDGGSASTKFASTYSGTLTVTFSGESIDNTTRTESASLLLRSDGTAKLTIDDEMVEGVMDGSTFGFSVRIVEKDGIIDCSADAVMTGSIAGSVGSGTISGRGECETLTAKTGVDMTGSMSVSK